jgi:hypothetical protein
MEKAALILSAVNLLAVFLAGGCAYREGVNSKWVGRPVSELVSVWGKPDSTLNLEDGRKVMIWSSFQRPEQVIPCKQSFTVNAEGTVEQFSSSDCPAEPIVPFDKDPFYHWNLRN